MMRPFQPSRRRRHPTVPEDDRMAGVSALEASAIDAGREREAVDPLVARARSGAFDAFETLYQRHARRIFGLCLRMTGDPGTAEDLTQDTFVRAWRRLGEFRGDAGFGTWLWRIAVRVALEHGRSRRRRLAREQLAPGPVGPSPVSAALDLERAIRTLPDGARSVFVLHDVEGRAHDEVARLLGITAGTSKSQLHRARRLLREALR
jgi:RNA polymerase sigma-70 factor (ECF subfamily)